MALDLYQVALHVQRLAGRLRDEQTRQLDRRTEAVQQLHAWDPRWTELDASLERTPKEHILWRPPRLHDGLVGKVSAGPCPPEYTVLAVDGSHIEPDRHRSVDCYLVNIGQVVLRYGPAASAVLASEASVYPGQPLTEDAESASDGDVQEEFDRAAITAQRTLQEMETLADLAASHATDPTLAFIDGSLFWNLGRYLRPRGEPGGREERLLRKYAEQLRRFRELARGRHLVLAGYVSFPGSHEVDDALRLAVCPADRRVDDLPHCLSKCPIATTPPEKRPCSSVGEVLDRDIFSDVLEIGERSAVCFTSHEQMKRRFDPDDQLGFYYLRTGAEVVRVEIPKWVVDNPELLDLSHTLCLDQAARGQGYPAALMEADALAAVSTQDRVRFWEMVERQLAQERIGMTTSAKSRSKRLRWI